MNLTKAFQPPQPFRSTAIVFCIGLLAGLSAEHSATAAEYYVDQARGDDNRTPQQATNAQTPWASIQTAADVAQPGDVVLVGPGLYRETVVPARAGTAQAPITYRALDPDDRPIIAGTAALDTQGWERTQINDFRGNSHEVYQTTLGDNPKALFQAGKRMFLAQEPNQNNPYDPYDLKTFMPVPEQPVSDTLTDPAFLKQGDRDDYWVGATLALWNSQNNAVMEFPITAADRTQGSITVENDRQPAIGNREGRDPDTYSIRDHLGVLDQPGEYYIDRSVQPYRLYLIPFPETDLEEVCQTARDHGINLIEGRAYLVFDGFIIREHADHGVNLYSQDTHDITFLNCEFSRNMSSGLAARYVERITIDQGLAQLNQDNGFQFANAKDIKVLNTEITANGDNGIWVGSGQPTMFNSDGILIRNCYIHHATARRRHPDNFQMHQVRNVTIEDCTFVQIGNQNMWCQYTDNFTLRNNIFVGGRLGINSSIHTKLHHNLFWDAGIRYDQHLTNHRQLGDSFLPREAVIQNNVFINSEITWPKEGLVDRREVFQIDHNYFAIDNQHQRDSWTWSGEKLSLKADTLVVSSVEISPAGSAVEANVITSWSLPAKLIFYYQDPDHFYWIGLGKEAGIYRRMAGQDELLVDDSSQAYRLPHQSHAQATYAIRYVSKADILIFEIEKRDEEGSVRMTIRDDDPAAIRRFKSGRFGFQAPAGNDYWVSVSGVQIEADGQIFRDQIDTDHAEAKPFTWSTIQGEVKLEPLGGFGIGIGVGSVLAPPDTDPATLFRALPSEEDNTGFDFRPRHNSPLVGAGKPIDVRTRSMGKTAP